jgi:hypothetical protein
MATAIEGSTGVGSGVINSCVGGTAPGGRGVLTGAVVVFVVPGAVVGCATGVVGSVGVGLTVVPPTITGTSPTDDCGIGAAVVVGVCGAVKFPLGVGAVVGGSG